MATNSNKLGSGERFETNNLLCKNAATFYKMVKIQKSGGVGTGLRVHAPAAFTDSFQVDIIDPTDPHRTVSINKLRFSPANPTDWEEEPPVTINDAINRIAAMLIANGSGPIKYLPPSQELTPSIEPTPEEIFNTLDVESPKKI